MKKSLPRVLCLVLVLALLAGAVPALADKDIIVTPDMSPYKSPKNANELLSFVYDPVNNVWNKYFDTTSGGKMQRTAFQRTDGYLTDKQYVDYLPASMDRPMFYTMHDENGTFHDTVVKYLTGNDVFTSGSIGTPESTGKIEFQCGKRIDTVTWTLKDSVLIINGTDKALGRLLGNPGNSPWCDNPYIRTVIIASGGEWAQVDAFYNCPNLTTVITLGVGGASMVSNIAGTTWPKNLMTADGKEQIMQGFKSAPDGGITLGIGLDRTINNQTHAYETVRKTSIRYFNAKNDDFIGIYSDATAQFHALDASALAVIAEYLNAAYLTPEAAAIINNALAEMNYDITVTANAAGSPGTTPTPTPEPTQPTTPVTIGYDPAATDGGSAANPICSAWARDDVIAAWNLFADRIPYGKINYAETDADPDARIADLATEIKYGRLNSPRLNIIEKDLTQPITRGEFATLAAAAFDYILGDTHVNDGYGNGTTEQGIKVVEQLIVMSGGAQELLEVHGNDISAYMEDLSRGTDVYPGFVNHYYFDGVCAATNMGLMNGYSDTAFGVDDHLTREQAATVLGRIADRYSAFPYRNNPGESAAFPASTGNPYTDTISDWALDGVLRARAAGIMIGTSDTEFSAKSDFTREQALVTLYRMVTWCKPWYRELTESELADPAVHIAANPIANEALLANRSPWSSDEK